MGKFKYAGIKRSLFTATKLSLLFAALFIIAAAGGSRQTQRTLQSTSPFPIGAAIDPGLLQHNPAYRHVVETEFNSITAENVLKWAGVHPVADRFDFTKGDILVAFAQDHNKRFHGHNLCWYQYNPAWLRSFNGDSLAWEQLFKTHIQTVVAHYKGKIESWDVVNEAFHEDGTLRVEDTNPADNNDDGCIWARHLGKDYIARAFEYAHEADPNALLFYNDYNEEISPAKLQAIINMVKDFKHRHIPINGLGLQMHININTPQAGITEAMRQFAATGLQVHIAELDISVNPKSDTAITYSTDLQNRQAGMFAFVVHQYATLIPKKQQYGITTWNVGDADSWIRHTYRRKDWPLLFDDNYAPKPVYDTVMNVLTAVKAGRR